MTFRSLRQTFLLAVAVLCAREAAAQQVIYVNAAAAVGGDGQSWSTAYNTLDAAIDEAALVPDAIRNATIFVARGSYVPGGFSGGATNLRYRPKSNTHIYGGFLGTETDIDERDPKNNATIITGDALGNEQPDGMEPALWFDNRSVLFDLQSCSNFTLDGFRLTKCVYTSTTPNAGGAIRMGNGGTNVVIRGCLFYRNVGGTGAAFNCVNLAGQPRFENCRFIGNSSTGGGAVHIQGGSAVFLSCAFISNQATGGGAPGCNSCNRGGAVSLSFNAVHDFRNCTFAQNSSPTNGATIFCDLGTPVLENCISTLAAPTAGQVTGPGTVTLINTIIPAGGATAPTVNNTNTLNADPLLQDPDGSDNIVGTLDDNGQLGSGSPAINSGDNLFVINGQMIEDAEGNRRIHNSMVDRGAYERSSPPYSPILFVKADATGGNDGSTWADAFSGPQGVANALALTGTNGYYRQVWVAGGTYTPGPPGSARTVSHTVLHGTRLYGGFAGGESTLAERVLGPTPSILSGDLNGDDNGLLLRGENAFHVVTLSSFSQAPTLDGFTISGGEANGGAGSNTGGGIFATFSQPPQIRNCIVQSNFAVTGGGFCLDSTVGGASLQSCDFRSNRAGSGGGGGVAHLSPSSGLYLSCTFTENTSVGDGGGFVCPASQPLPQLGNCSFVRNSATGPTARGGGLFALSGILVDGCKFFGNSAAFGGGMAWFTSGSNLMISANNSLFVGNTATTHGGGAFVGSASLLQEAFISCTFVANRCGGNASGGVHRIIPTPGALGPVCSSILWGNTGLVGGGLTVSEQTQISVSAASAATTDCIVQGNPGTNRALLNGLDPLFLRLPSPGLDAQWGTTDDDYGDLRIAPGSPAIDCGYTFGDPPSQKPVDYVDLDHDGSIREVTPFDLGGTPRLVDDPATFNAGAASPEVTLDRGCYEFQPGCPTCPGVREWLSPVTASALSTYSWSISVPTSQHDTRYSQAGAYSATFAPLTHSTVTHRSALVDRGDVTFDLAGNTLRYTLTTSTALNIGSAGPSDDPIVRVVGGTVRAPSVRIANEPLGSGTLNVAGAGARLLVVEDALSVGYLGVGELNITGGATANTRIASVGDQPGSFGSVVVDGPGSVWTVPFFLTVNNGTVTVRNGGTLNAGFGVFLLQNATLSGDGTINGDVVNFGVVEPGNSPGTLTVSGAYTQVGEIPDFGSSSGRLTMQVDGTGPGQFDRLVVQGPTQLGGGLIVESPAGGFPMPPEAGLSLPVIDALGGIAANDLTGLPADHFDVAFFPRVPGPGGGPSDKFLRLDRPEGGGATFFTLTTGLLGAPLSVNDPSNTSATSTPSSVTPGDLDGDGLDDLVLTTPSNNSAVILMNRGTMSGEWQGFEGAVQFAVGTNPQAAGIFDIDQDGLPDISIANAGSNSVTLFRNNTVVGSHVVALSGQGSLSTGATPTGIDINHFDGSGTRPVIITTDEADGSISILIRTGAPGFTFTPRTSKPVPTSTPPRQPRCLDIDGDGAHPDLALLSASGGAVLVLQNISVGLGIVAFGDAITMPVDSGPVHLEVAALRDGRPSLVTVNAAGNTLSVLVNTADIANPVRFAPTVNVPAGSGPISLAAVDVDGDSDADLAVLTDTGTGINPIKVRLLRNDYIVDGVQQNDQVTFVNDRDLPDDGAPTDALFVIAARLASPGVTDLLTVNSQGGGRGPGEMALNVRPRLNSTMGGGVNTCFVDFNNDGVVSPDDLDEFITTYFSEPPDNSPSDFNHDGIVSPDDLDEFITAYFEGC